MGKELLGEEKISMPTTVLDADGNEIEALTAEEVADLQARAEKAQDLESKVAELQKQIQEEGNPNWREARAKMDKLQSFIKEKGFSLNDDGTVSDVEKVDPNKIKEELRSELKEESFQETKSELLDEYDDQTKPLIEKYVNKLLSGEEKNLKNLKSAFKEAEKLVGVGETNRVSRVINGQPPKFNQDGKSFADTEEGKSIAKEMFGESSFINNK